MNIGDTIILKDIPNITILREHMYINKLSIENIGCITNLKLQFNNKFNVICGANGIGKTTILNTLAHIFSSGGTQLKKNANSECGVGKISYTLNNEICHATIRLQNFLPSDKDYASIHLGTDYFIRFGLERDIKYQKTSAISSDPNRPSNVNGSVNLSGVSATDLKNWFVNRFAFHDKDRSLSVEEQDNFLLAKNIFGVLDPTCQFKTVLAKSFDIILSTPNGDIYFEYLSSGYKSCIFIIMNIIKEIEYRFSEHPIRAIDFDGCVLIDEIEEHLHPTWQARLVKALKEIFPKAQFIVTTHSPSILQSLDKDEIIPLYLDENNQTAIKPLELGEYGLQGWTLEEILKDVMGMPSTTSTLYSDTIQKFDEAVNNEDEKEIMKQYHILEKMLHPANPLRRLLKIQVAEWED